jgi:hypothetical protein
VRTGTEDTELLLSGTEDREMPPSGSGERNDGREDLSDGREDLRERLVSELATAPRPVVNTHYLMKRLDLPFDPVYRGLERLADEGTVEHATVRDRGHLWWLSRDSRRSE